MNKSLASAALSALFLAIPAAGSVLIDASCYCMYNGVALAGDTNCQNGPAGASVAYSVDYDPATYTLSTRVSISAGLFGNGGGGFGAPQAFEAAVLNLLDVSLYTAGPARPGYAQLRIYGATGSLASSTASVPGYSGRCISSCITPFITIPFTLGTAFDERFTGQASGIYGDAVGYTFSLRLSEESGAPVAVAIVTDAPAISADVAVPEPGTWLVLPLAALVLWRRMARN